MADAWPARLPLPLQRIWQRQAPGAGLPSPCVGICRMVPATACCEGCGRTLDEIAGWGQATEAQKHAVWQAIAARQPHTPCTPLKPAA